MITATSLQFGTTVQHERLRQLQPLVGQTVRFGVEPQDPANREPMIGLITLGLTGMALLAALSLGVGALIHKAANPSAEPPAKIERSVNP